MSVVVRGMEMPVSGTKYRVVEDLEGNKYLMPDGVFSGRYYPISPLPKRHGRLIEAESLRAEFPYPSEGMGGWRNPNEALVHKTGVWAAIDCAETIVEAEGE